MYVEALAFRVETIAAQLMYLRKPNQLLDVQVKNVFFMQYSYAKVSISMSSEILRNNTYLVVQKKNQLKKQYTFFKKYKNNRYTFLVHFNTRKIFVSF